MSDSAVEILHRKNDAGRTFYHNQYYASLMLSDRKVQGMPDFFSICTCAIDIVYAGLKVLARFYTFYERC